MSKRKAEMMYDHSDAHAEVSPTKKKAVSGDESSVNACELSRTRKVVVKKYKGKVFVDIREYYSKDGLDLPGKKGISLPLDQWNVLKSHFAGIEEVINNLK